MENINLDTNQNKSNMSNIFDIIEELDRVFYDIEEQNGVLTPDIEARLSVSQEEFNEKLDAYAYYIKKMDVNNKLLKDEIDMFNRKIESNKKRQERLKDIMVFALTKFGEQKDNGEYKLSTEARTFWTQISKSVQVNEDFKVEDYISRDISFNIRDKDYYHEILSILLDNELCVETKPKIDKKALKSDLDKGVDIEGAELIKKRGIRFR